MPLRLIFLSSKGNQTVNTAASPLSPEAESLLPEVYKNIFNTSPHAALAEADSDASDIVFTHIDKAKELLTIEFYKSADKEIAAASKDFENNNFGILQISTMYLMAGDYISSQRIISQYYSKLNRELSAPYKDYFYYLRYPYGYKLYVDKYSTEFGVDPLFVLAVIREESRFNPEAISFAGARGLMQVMPATGRGIASAMGIKNFDIDMLLDAETSVKMGAYYLSRQLASFNQNKYYACGAYNGGPGAMNRWISRHGELDIDEFIENISYNETREYVKKVMGSYFFYQLLYKEGYESSSGYLDY